MRRCPPASPGARTYIEETSVGVVVTVTGKTPEVVQDIRARASALMERAREPRGEGARAGEKRGRCPVVLQDTEISRADVDGGVQFTVKANDPGSSRGLLRESRERLATMLEP